GAWAGITYVGNTRNPRTPDRRHSRARPQRRESQTPLLGKGGVAAPSSKWSRSFRGAAGHERSECEPDRAKQGRMVRSTSDNRWFEPTTPSAPAKEASRHFFNGRSHPSFTKEGNSAFPSVLFQCPRSGEGGPKGRMRGFGFGLAALCFFALGLFTITSFAVSGSEVADAARDKDRQAVRSLLQQ